ncbi:aromatic ring-hydroxylating dioxygenase subunit alpha [soil metagenome]
MFLRDTWYVAAWSAELKSDMTARRLLDEPVLLFRTPDGKPAALSDRCPHRFAPLHLGKLEDGIVECGYHGLQFDSSGACVKNPHGDCRIPASARVRSYPVVEAYEMVWIWMGDPANADSRLIPDFSFMDDPERGFVSGFLTVKAGYELETDNLLDLSHTQFVHDDFHASDAILKGQLEVKQDGNTVHSNLWCPNGHASPQMARRMRDSDVVVDQWLDMRWDPPCVLRLDTGVTPAGTPREGGAQSYSVHILTPETETSTHYFFANARNYAVGDPATDESIRRWQQIGFGEQDRRMLEAVQASMGTTDLMSLKPVLLPIDAGPMRARRILKNMIAAENEKRQSRPVELVASRV